MSDIQTKEYPERENKMGTMPVPKLLITMSLPMMISMPVQALYNICLLYTSPSPRDKRQSRMPSSA